MLKAFKDLGTMTLAYGVNAKNQAYKAWPNIKFYASNNLIKTFLMITAVYLIVMSPFTTPLVFLASFLASSTGFMVGYSTIGDNKVPGIVVGTPAAVIATIMVGTLSSLPGVGPVFGIISSVISGGLLFTYAKEDYVANVALKTATQDTQPEAWVKAQGTIGSLLRLVETPTRLVINHFSPDTVIATFKPKKEPVVFSPRNENLSIAQDTPLVPQSTPLPKRHLTHPRSLAEALPSQRQ